nr:hypothetical protein [Tanacetum cinerariifolium]
MGAGLCWGEWGRVVGVNGMEEKAGNVGEMEVTGVAGNLGTRTVPLNRGGKTGYVLENLHNWSLWLTRTNTISLCGCNSFEEMQDQSLSHICVISPMVPVQYNFDHMAEMPFVFKL